MPDLALLIAVAALALGLAAALLLLSSRLRKASGLPTGRVLQEDTGARERGRPLFSARYGLTGTPDYLVQTRRGLIPVEVKPGRTEAEPHDSHLLQVLAYCLLVEETQGKAPPYGLLRYSQQSFKVDYNPHTRAYLLDVMERMRADAGSEDVHRSHEVQARCRRCAYREVCDEAL